MRQVYFVVGGGRIKVGVSGNLRLRLKHLAVEIAGPVELLGTVSGSEAIERAIHRHLEFYRLEGEWFCDCEPVRDFISKILGGQTSVSDLIRDGGKDFSFRKMAMELWPQYPARVIEGFIGVSDRTVRSWVSGTNEPPASVIVALLRSRDGDRVLAWIMRAAASLKNAA